MCIYFQFSQFAYFSNKKYTTLFILPFFTKLLSVSQSSWLSSVLTFLNIVFLFLFISCEVKLYYLYFIFNTMLCSRGFLGLRIDPFISYRWYRKSRLRGYSGDGQQHPPRILQLPIVQWSVVIMAYIFYIFEKP